MKDTYHKYNIVPLKKSEWSILKKVRLAALSTDPSSFGESYKNASKLSDDEWEKLAEEYATSENRDTLIAYMDETPVGMVFVFVREDKKTGGIGGLWLNPEFRGLGLGLCLLWETYDWLKKRNVYELTCWNNKSNEASTSFYEYMGFEYTGEEMPLESDQTKIISQMRKKLN